MMCEVCGKKQAERMVVRIHKEEVLRCACCVECAAERVGFYSRSEISLSDMLSRMSLKLGKTTYSAYRCELCGMTLAEVSIDKQPGCCLCYMRFCKELEPSIESVQGKYPHFGKNPLQSC